MKLLLVFVGLMLLASCVAGDGGQRKRRKVRGLVYDIC